MTETTGPIFTKFSGLVGMEMLGKSGIRFAVAQGSLP